MTSPAAPSTQSSTLRLARIAAGLLFTAVLGVFRPASAAPTDYSNDPLNPSVVNINSLGQFVFEGHVGTGFNVADYITINVPQGLAITSINLNYYDSTDDRGFVAVQPGTQFTAVPNTTNGTLPGSVAFNHFGWRGLCSTSYGSLRPTPASANNNCIDGTNTTPVTTATNTNLFTNLLAGSPRIDSSGVLAAGDYSFWIQQPSGDSFYTFTVQTGAAPAPGPLPLAGAVGAFGWSRRLRRRLSNHQSA